MSHRMTDDQRRAVETLAGDVVVRAGAGSGKTTVIAHRFAHSLLPGDDGEARARIDGVLTITFTNKAAAEIAERVRRVVTAELSAQQGRRIDEAWISTIHSFCARLVRRHVLEAGVEPYFGQADDVTTDALKGEAFERVAERLYAADEGAREALDTFSPSHLRSIVFGCHDNARALGLDPSAIVVPLDAAELEPFVDDVRERAIRLAEVLERVKQSDSVADKRRRLAQWDAELRACDLGAGDACDRLLGLRRDYDIARLPSDAKEANDDLKAALASLSSCAAAVKKHALFAGLELLMRGFATEFAALKSERGLLDFDDLQERAVMLLEQEPAVAEAYRRQFSLIMVDEFQDTNELQMRVLSPMRDDNLCVVGDERQSIYGFRYANVEIFERLSRQTARGIPLSANFRSHAGVLDFVNYAFGLPHLFGPSFMQLDPRRTEGWKLPIKPDEARVACILVDADDADAASGRSLEAELVAERIRILLDAGVKGGDIAVLLRTSRYASVFAAALEGRGVPVLLNAGSTLFDAPEVDEVTALMRAVAVPTDDQALLRVLASRLVGLSDDGLLGVRAAAGSGPLWSGLERIAQTAAEQSGLTEHDTRAIAHVVDALRMLSKSAGSERLSQLIRRACEAFDYDITLHTAGPAGVRAWANVLKIMRYADAFEQAESSDPAEFVAHLSRRSDSGGDRAAPGQVGDDAVQIMTIHAAKGLEFPAVFVVDLGSAKSKGAGPALVERGEIGGRPCAVVGARLPRGAHDGAATPAYLRMRGLYEQREADEEKRCLYVACTRAEELLVLSGCCSIQKPPADGKALIDWVREAIDAGLGPAGDVAGVPVNLQCCVAEKAEAAPEAEWEGRRRSEPLFVPSTDAEPPVAVRTIPPMVSYSALHRLERCPLSFYATHVARIGAYQPPGDAVSRHMGSAAHAALQEAVAGELTVAREAAIAAGFGLDDDGRAKVTASVRRFMDSTLASRIKRMERVYAEQPLVVSLGGSLLVGSIDLIGWQGAHALIVDYKTGRSPDMDRSGAREAGYLLQANCYALAALEAGAEEVEVVFAFVDHEETYRRFGFTASDATVIHGSLSELLDRATNKDLERLAAYDEEVCGDCCALGGICPIDPPHIGSRAGSSGQRR
jgi:ATP-dependent helicase/nuclease subunit A